MVIKGLIRHQRSSSITSTDQSFQDTVPQVWGEDGNSCGRVRTDPQGHVRAETFKSNSFPKGFQLPPNVWTNHNTPHRGSDVANVRLGTTNPPCMTPGCLSAVWQVQVRNANPVTATCDDTRGIVHAGIMSTRISRWTSCYVLHIDDNTSIVTTSGGCGLHGILRC